ncbi:hypothetical protein AUQ48_11780 [Kocuria flava]|uniref:Aminoacyl-transfer RNA synthetases class-II family profile domain-containing protein n=1 Tax=Kocuria flava TaxID=446860 RepID=A0A2N4T3K2_9MICC|nr:bifunctional lysylphosphatidylglycerol synthetase/lysine--tRNA ligase LysX [Kocuria flava]PLC12776.1 hypothetical protein AUQ48_11780 [Kocuria flava]
MASSRAPSVRRTVSGRLRGSGARAGASKRRWARALTWLYACATVVAAVLWVMGLAGRPVGVPVVVFGSLNVPLAPSVVSVVLLALVTGALLRRRRIALGALAAFAGLGMLASAGVLAGLWTAPPQQRPPAGELAVRTAVEVIGILAALATMRLVWWLREKFPARTRAGAVRAAGAVLIAGTVLSAAGAHVLLLVTTRTTLDDWQVLLSAVLHALGLRPPGAPYHHWLPQWIPQLTSVLLALTVLLAVYVLLRSGRSPAAWTPDQELTVRLLLREHGQQDSLGYFATRRDREAVFAPGRRAAVTFRVVGPVCLAGGDPVGDPDSWEDAVRAWMGYARSYGWIPAVLGASEAGARTCLRAGRDVLAVGDEAVLQPQRFSLTGAGMAAVHRAVRRARRSGLRVEIRRHEEIDPAELAVLGDLADRWRGAEPDRGFSMALNRWGDPADGRCVAVTAHRPDGRVAGLLSFVPWGAHGLSLDVMRRAPDAPHGTTELMVAELMEQGLRRGISKVSLNFAAFRKVFVDADRLGAGTVTRLNSTVLDRLGRYFQLERLYRANDKYRPEWTPRFLCFDGALTLPRVSLAVLRAEGFLPSVLRRPGRPLRLTPSELARVLEIESTAPQVRPQEPRRSQHTRHRLRHARMLRDAGMDPYPIGLAGAVPVRAVTDLHPDRVRVHGRVRALRRHGGVLFADLVHAGVGAQVVLEREVLGRSRFGVLSRALDTGDLVVVTATVGLSRSGTASLLATDLVIAAKALHPVPFTGFEDPGARLRRRSTDLLVHPRLLQRLDDRSTVVAAVRGLLLQQGYREVETPVLHRVHGGASARPFRTRSNAYGMELSLRIAPELYLKRLLVAGAGPLFEIGRNFRNEGADATHNPEFTSLEAYRPLADYRDMKDLVQQLVLAAATAVHGAPVLPLRGGPDPSAPSVLTDVSAPWPVVTVTEAVSRAVGRPVSVHTDPDELFALARGHDLRLGAGAGPGAVLEELYAALVERLTIRPTFYVDFPAETSPLTAPHRRCAGLAERWDLVVNGMELGTAYTELTDPLEQRRRLTEQSWKAAAGDVEAMEVDEDFLYALETGMPPAGGLGLGMDRLVMLLTGATIRDVLSFPFVRPPSPR